MVSRSPLSPVRLQWAHSGAPGITELLNFLACLVSIAAGVLPTAAYVLIVWRIDRYEKEPMRLLAAAFLWGALPAVILAVVVEQLLGLPFTALAAPFDQLISASLIAPPAEEFVKALALLGLFRLAHYEFDGVLDGIIYGSLIGFGFAMTENILYFLGSQTDLRSWSTVVVGRALAFGFNHAMFTSLTGIGLGLARYVRSVARRRLLIVVGVGAATTAHFFHNFFLSTDSLCLLSLLLDWLGVLVVLVIVVLTWRRERGWIEAQLAEEVEWGVISRRQLEAVTSRRRRWAMAWGALGTSGWQEARLQRSLAQSATELAFKKHQREAMGEEGGNSVTIASLRDEIMSIRRRLGDPVAFDAIVCPSCGRPWPENAVGCAHCGTTWAEEPVG